MTAKKPISNPENYLKDIRRKTRRIFTAEQKILIVMEAFRVENSIAELCRKHAIQESTFYKWNKEVSQLREENRMVKETVADLVIRYDIVKKV